MAVAVTLSYGNANVDFTPDISQPLSLSGGRGMQAGILGGLRFFAGEHSSFFIEVRSMSGRMKFDNEDGFLSYTNERINAGLTPYYFLAGLGSHL